jgi:hypothetical protein
MQNTLVSINETKTENMNNNNNTIPSLFSVNVQNRTQQPHQQPIINNNSQIKPLMSFEVTQPTIKNDFNMMNNNSKIDNFVYKPNNSFKNNYNNDKFKRNNNNNDNNRFQNTNNFKRKFTENDNRGFKNKFQRNNNNNNNNNNDKNNRFNNNNDNNEGEHDGRNKIFKPNEDRFRNDRKINNNKFPHKKQDIKPNTAAAAALEIASQSNRNIAVPQVATQQINQNLNTQQNPTQIYAPPSQQNVDSNQQQPHKILQNQYEQQTWKNHNNNLAGQQQQPTLPPNPNTSTFSMYPPYYPPMHNYQPNMFQPNFSTDPAAYSNYWSQYSQYYQQWQWASMNSMNPNLSAQNTNNNIPNTNK